MNRHGQTQLGLSFTKRMAAMSRMNWRKVKLRGRKSVRRWLAVMQERC